MIIYKNVSFSYGAVYVSKCDVKIMKANSDEFSKYAFIKTQLDEFVIRVSEPEHMIIKDL